MGKGFVQSETPNDYLINGENLITTLTYLILVVPQLLECISQYVLRVQCA